MLGLKSFTPLTWETAENAAERRKTLQNDQFSNTAETLRTKERRDGTFYHSKCLSQFCAVKRRTSASNDPSEPASKSTRSSSILPLSNDRGVLGHECLFCKRKRKRKSNVREYLHQCLTKDGSKAILTAARKKGDARISGLGEDLIAKEAKHHNRCRRDYVRQSVAVESSNRKKHDEAFQKLSHFVGNEVFKKKTPILAATLLSVYSLPSL